MKGAVRVITILQLCLALFHVQAVAEDEVTRFEFENYGRVLELFETLGYTPEAWQAGIRGVNRVYLQKVPARWRSSVSKDIEVQLKKRLFLRAMAPLVLRANELIMGERARLRASLEQGRSGAAFDSPWLRETAIKYRVTEGPDQPVDEAGLEELLKRIDIVPPSLALAQAIEESGWGTSRFAQEGNALFGMWAWGENAMKPQQQRSGKGDYGIARWDSPQQSVDGYMLNINRHPAYAAFRTERARIRADGHSPTGSELVGTLTHYSERGQAYVDGLNGLMNYNKLHDVDDAQLTGPVIHLVPVEATAE